MSAVRPSSGSPSGPDPSPEEIRTALAAVLASHAFSTSPRLRRFLAYIVEETLAGRADGLKEYSLGMEVCDRGADFDPRADPVVRVEARRLRARLADYYAGEGHLDPLILTVPKGGYVPVAERRRVGEAAAPDAASPGTLGAEEPGRAESPFPKVLETGVVGSEAPAVTGTSRRWRHAVLAALVVGAAALVAAVAHRLTSSTPLASPTGLAVLPFRNLTADADNDHFCFGLTEDLTAALSELKGLRIVARTSAERAGVDADLTQVARQLRVRYLVEGSVRRDGRRLRVSARLVDSADGASIWADTYDREVEDVFAVQQGLSQAIAAALVTRLGLAPQPARVRRPPNAEAHAAFLRGQFLFRTRPGEHDRAIALLERAIALDPGHAAAHFELAAVRAAMALDRISPPPDLVQLARAGVERALALDAGLADALALRAWIRFFNDWDWSGAEQGFLEALAVNPSSSVAHHRYALMLMTAGRFDEAIAHAEQALQLDPLSYRLVNGCAVIYFCARRHAEAERLAHDATVLAPDYFLAHLIRGSALVEQRRFDEGIASYHRALEAVPDEPDALASLGRALALAGRADEARAVLARLTAADVRIPPSRYELAFLRAALGDRDGAFADLEASLAAHETELVYLGVDPLFDVIRDDPRFDAVLDRVGVPRP